MNSMLVSEQDLLRQTIIEVANLPKQDLATVLELVNQLKQKPQTGLGERRRLVFELLTRAQKRADELKTLPRTEITARLRNVINEIQQEAVVKGVAIDDEWQDG
ncbi:MAG: hypothetical protein M3Q45_10395 [Chloroflexota bacterium]|nr:hypothetical protein [Chloroflexota bacterium]